MKPCVEDPYNFKGIILELPPELTNHADAAEAVGMTISELLRATIQDPDCPAPTILTFPVFETKKVSQYKGTIERRKKRQKKAAQKRKGGGYGG